MKILSEMDIQEGCVIPRWYLPVERLNYSMRIRCYWIGIAPFVLVWVIIKNVFRSIWRDLFDWSEMLKRWNSSKHVTSTTPLEKKER